jgi:hypothetical protein
MISRLLHICRRLIHMPAIYQYTDTSFFSKNILAGPEGIPDGTRFSLILPALISIFFEKLSPTHRLETCNCSATANGHIK